MLKRFFGLLASLLLIAAMTGCSGKQDTLRFVKENSSPADRQWAEYEVNIGNKTGGGKVTAELWQNGVCTESTPVIINNETKTLNIGLSAEGHGASEGPGKLNVQIDTDEKAGSMLTCFELPAQIVGYSFSAYENGELIDAEPGTETILAAMAFDTGSGVRSVDCGSMADEPDRVSEYSCVLLIRASFTAEQIFPEQDAAA